MSTLKEVTNTFIQKTDLPVLLHKGGSGNEEILPGCIACNLTAFTTKPFVLAAIHKEVSKDR